MSCFPFQWKGAASSENGNLVVNRMEIVLAKERDIAGWMKLVDAVKGNFPGLESKVALEEHRKTVLDFMGRDSAICAKCDGKIVGALLFSKEHQMLCFFGGGCRISQAAYCGENGNRDAHMDGPQKRCGCIDIP